MSGVIEPELIPFSHFFPFFTFNKTTIIHPKICWTECSLLDSFTRNLMDIDHFHFIYDKDILTRGWRYIKKTEVRQRHY